MSGHSQKKIKLVIKKSTSSGQNQNDEDAAVSKLKLTEDNRVATRHEISCEPRDLKKSEIKLVSDEDDQEVEHDVTRLDYEEFTGEMRKKPDEIKFEKRDTSSNNDEKKEQQWGHGAHRVSWWLLGSGSALLLVIVGAVVFSNYIAGRGMEKVDSEEITLDLEDPFKGSPEQWFRQREVKLRGEATSLVKEYLAASKMNDKSRFVRNPERYLAEAPKWPFRLRPRLDRVSENSWEISHTGETAFLTLDTEDEDFLPTRVYFTRQGEQLKIDWFASMAWSEKSFPDFKKTLAHEDVKVTENEDGSVTLRCLLRRKNEYYNGPYNDREHAVFMIMSPDKEHYFWVYTNRDSALDDELRKILDHGRFVVSLKKDIRVTLRVKKGRKDALPSQLELLELVHPEWITP